MVGQTNLVSKIKSYNINNFPQTILLVGDKGCGKHLLVNEIISPHLNLDVIDITENISFDYLMEIQLKSIPYIYLIDTNQITEKQQNIILKFIEEPLSNSYVILLADNKSNLLNTIINRCFVFQFEPYTNEELSSFVSFTQESKEFVLKIANTPGQLINTNEKHILEIKELCDKVATKLTNASFYNVITRIPSRINFKEYKDKLDLNMFFNALSITLSEEYARGNNDLHLKLYYKVEEYKNKLLIPRVNKEYLFENFIISIWKLARI